MEKLSYEEFKEAVVSEISHILPGTKINLHPVLKSNNRRLDGITLGERGDLPQPTLYFNDWYGVYESGGDIPGIARRIVEISKTPCPARVMDMKSLENFENAKDMLCCKLINSALNEELLSYTPHLDFLDLAVVFYLLVKVDDGIVSCLVPDSMFDAWGKTAGDVAVLAAENTKKLNPMNVISGDDLADEPDFPDMSVTGLPDIFIITSSNMRNGAIYMLDRELLGRYAEEMGSDLLILPHSVDGVVITAYNEDFAEVARRICADVEIDAEYLSDHPYIFDRALGKVVM